jgi:hypothetical protein
MKALMPDGRFHIDHLNSLLGGRMKGCEIVELMASETQLKNTAAF